MKKLIALATVAVVGVAIAGTTPCKPDQKSTPATTNAAVYAWKFTGKTTVGYIIKDTIKGGSGSVCKPGATNTYAQCAIRIPGSLAIQGYSYICDNCCDQFATTVHGTGTEDAFYMTKPFKSALTAKIALDVAHIIGKKATQYEAEGKAEFTVAEPSEKYTLTFAGLGTYNQKWPSVASVSGNFAGIVESPFYVKSPVCAPADYWNCALDFAGQPTDPSVAYGTWSVKLNTSASKKYREQGKTIALPSWL